MLLTRTMSKYTKDAVLSDKSTITIRPMLREDEKALLDFFRRIPEEDRFYPKDDVTSSEVIRNWAESQNFDEVVPFLAIRDGRTIADGTLHKSRARARRHIGEIRIVVDPDFRNIGVSRAVMREMVESAYGEGLETLTFEVVRGKEEAAIRAARIVGSSPIATLSDLFREVTGESRDLMVMAMHIRQEDDYLLVDNY